ncbi:MAG: PAS domain-containing protein [Isosphaeraceae bacterium]
MNRRWSEYTGLDPADLVSRGWRQAVHPDDAERSAEWWASAVPGEKQENLEWLRRGSGRRVPLAPLAGRAGAGRRRPGARLVRHLDGYRRPPARRGGAAVPGRGQLRAGASLDYHATLAEVACLAVPELADWCVIDVADPDGSLRRVAAVHADPDTQHRSETFREPLPARRGVLRRSRCVVRTGRPVLIPDPPQEPATAPRHARDHLEAVESLSLRSLICVPLPARARSGRSRRSPPREPAACRGRPRPGRGPGRSAPPRPSTTPSSSPRPRPPGWRPRPCRRGQGPLPRRALARACTPLTPVLVGVTAMLEDPDLPESVRPVLDVTRRNVALEARLIDDLLDVTRIAQGSSASTANSSDSARADPPGRRDLPRRNRRGQHPARPGSGRPAAPCAWRPCSIQQIL